MMVGMTRSWAGTTLAERREERRRRLLDVGLELLGTSGAAAVSVRSVCRAAGLTDRYFYENFADRDALLVAVFDEVAAEFGGALVSAVEADHPDKETLARAAVEAFLDVMVADPRKGRVLLIEPLSSPAIGGQGLAVSPMFVALVRAQLDEPSSEDDALLGATAIVGALTSLFVRWLDGTLEVDRDTLSAFCVRLLLTAASLTAG
ncbi:MAG: transcriptional regulator [Jatrophihabitans sp.]|nr:transcriptional regulator [Jatrophihabitans sp.]